VNVSLNSTVAQSYHTSPLSAAVEILWFNSIVVVVSAGNNGTGDGPVTLFPPANDPFVITVGAVEDKGTTGVGDDTLAVFSAYGTTEDGFAKPDLLAPGRNLIAPLAAKASTAYTDHPLHRVDDYYFRMSGTSMSAPVVTGAVALLLEDEPGLNPAQVKYRLMATANTNWSSVPSGSTGYLDVYEAIYSTTTDHANQGIMPSQMLASGEDGIDFASVGWNTVGWNTVGWNTVGWNTVGWNSVGWNTVGWNSVGWNSVGWNASVWDN
jgi:serine protease AprX